jgi:hypothetical protein
VAECCLQQSGVYVVRRENQVVITATDRPAFKVGDVVHKVDNAIAKNLSNGVLYERLQRANVSIQLFNASKPPVAKCSKIRMSDFPPAIKIEIQRLDDAGFKGAYIRKGLKSLFPELGDVGIPSRSQIHSYQTRLKEHLYGRY